MNIRNRRFFPNHYLPSQYSEAIKHITVAVDLSGSINKDMLDGFMSEVKYIQETMKPEKLTILGWDTEISDEIILEEGEDPMGVSFTGGGGTDIFDLCNWINNHNPTITIIFTDGEYQEYTDDVNSDCLFIIRDNPNYVSNFGETIHFN